MKNIIVFVLLITSLSMSAQKVTKRKMSSPDLSQGNVLTTESGSSKRKDYSGWFDYVSSFNAFNNPQFVYSLRYLHPDSNFNVIYSDNSKLHSNYHVYGRVNDPRDEVFVTRFSRHNTYTWDSIRFIQYYLRFADSMMLGNQKVEIVDTIYVQYFKPSGLENSYYTLNSNPNKKYFYSSPIESMFNWKTKMNTMAFRTDTILLRKSDADSVFLDGEDSEFYGSTVTIAVGEKITQSPTNINASLAAHTITFKPMKRPALGDTGIAYNGSKWVNRYNCYALREYFKPGYVYNNESQEAQNNSIIVDNDFGYGQTVNGFKSYLPGALYSPTLFEGTEYHLSTKTLDLNSVSASRALELYPNPALAGDNVFMPIKLSEQQTVMFSIYDVTGQLIRNISVDMEAGDFDYAISTQGLSAGVYTCEITTVSGRFLSKFVLN